MSPPVEATIKSGRTRVLDGITVVDTPLVFPGPRRFEIEGADAARAFARDFGERFVPGYARPSAVDFLMDAPFEE